MEFRSKHAAALSPDDQMDRALVAAMPDIDWSGTPLGPPEQWPTELSTAARIVMASRFPSALIWGEQLTTLHNAAFTAILGGKPNAQGVAFSQVWHEAWDRLAPIVERAYRGEATFIEDFPLAITRNGYLEQAYFTFCYSPVFAADGTVLGMIDTVVETTAHFFAASRSSALVELGDRLRDARSPQDVVSAASDLLGRTLDVMRAGYADIDERAGRFTVETDWTRSNAASLAGQHDLGGFGATLDRSKLGEPIVVRDVAVHETPATDRDALLAIGAVARIHVPLVERGALVGMLYVHEDRRRDWSARDIGFVRAVADRSYAAIGKLRAEAEQELLNNELDHRLKNMMSMVQAIAAQTLRGATDPEALAAFEHRIVALARAHELLVRQSGASTSQRAIVDAMLTLHGGGGRFAVSGFDVKLGPKAALSLALILHELATNAAKYGALSVPDGRVQLGWNVAGSIAERTLTLTWRETGGPVVVEPERKGFGSRLIRLGLANSRDVVTVYDPAGLQATFKASLALLQEQ